MYKILIVDDDRLIIEDILSLIDWKDIFCETPDCEYNGLDALKKIQKNNYDIVITDISMPKLNGVDLIRETKKFGIDTQFIIISNFDDFIYVKEAMKLGALEYILKYQIDKDNLKEEIIKAIEIIKKNKNHELLEGKYRVEIRRAIEYIMSNYSKDISLEQLADISELSPNYLSKIFKQETGLNYSNYVKKVRLDEAKRLLEESSLRINEIAESVGFDDYRYFTRIFKEYTGMTCKGYRKYLCSKES